MKFKDKVPMRCWIRSIWTGIIKTIGEKLYSIKSRKFIKCIEISPEFS
jgi:hypothetical protein